MRIRLPLYLSIAAASLLAVIVVSFCRAGDSEERVPRGPTRIEPEMRTPASHGDRSAVATAPSSRSQSLAASKSARRPPSSIEEPSIPTELPDSPRLEAQLSRNGNVPDWREQYTYQLGLMASYDKCMNARVRHGIVYYYIKWQV